MKRVMCIWFPNWPLQRVLSGRPELKQRPCVLYQTSGRRGAQVVAASPEAYSEGVFEGMPLAEAKALLETNVSRYTSSAAHYELYDPQADLAGLRWLTWQCQSFTPLVGMEQSENPDSLLLDITGCAHLFASVAGLSKPNGVCRHLGTRRENSAYLAAEDSNERKLAAQVTLWLHRQGFFAHVAIANTIGAAWAIAHCGADTAGLSRRLSSLPVEALRIPDKLVQDLHEFDLWRIGQLMLLPRSSLPSRFGSIVTQRLDQALGHVPEILVPERPPEPLEARWPFEEPAVDRRVVQAAIKQLIERIITKLQTRHEGVLQLVMRLQSAGGKPVQAGDKPVQLSIGLVQPSASISHLFELICIQMERSTLPRDVLDIHIRVTRTAPLSSHQHELFNTHGDRDCQRELNVLLERLSSRLGCRSVLRPQLYPDAQPELAVRYAPLIGQDKGVRSLLCEAPDQPSVGARPFRQKVPDTFFLPLPSSRPVCFHLQPIPVTVTSVVPAGPPIRLHLKNRNYTIASRHGPERIETGWWRPQPIRRDYYRIELSDGRRFWLFRNLDDGQWFLHGSFE